MSDKKDNKEPSEDLTYPPPAHVRTPHSADAPVLDPENKPQLQQQDLGKGAVQAEQDDLEIHSLDWLIEAINSGATKASSTSDPQKDKVEDDAKKQDSGGSSNANPADEDEWPKQP
ncbi:hypothetical protein ONZ43_g340 [Nemania bipapillata]|uniref:Uncharacterized protein n=1 Tax=Nemania bipapillata TaxID=110536 RepID=A0ACC2J8F9_9PEZI|nr:hypothetical protein ONZ43_g340 [Nemania bipapillata]